MKKFENPTKSHFPFVHRSVTYCRAVATVLFFSFNKKCTAHTPAHPHSVIKIYSETNDFCQYYTRTHAHTCQFTQNDETYSWVGWNFTNFSRLEIPYWFSMLDQYNRDFYTLLVLLNNWRGEIVVFRDLSLVILSILLKPFAGAMGEWIKRMHWASICVVSFINFYWMFVIQRRKWFGKRRQRRKMNGNTNDDDVDDDNRNTFQQIFIILT